MQPLIALSQFEMVMPSLLLDQQQVLDHTVSAHNKDQSNKGQSGADTSLLMKRYGVKSKQIAQRAFENINIAADGADILERTKYFGTKARDVFSQFYKSKDKAPDHIVHVTCTGYISPSPAQHLVNDKQWTETTNVTHAYHMGCYAALPAVRMAEGFVAAKNHNVDIVHTEMCGLHMDTSDHSPEQLVVQSLFADGHIKYTAQPAHLATEGFRVLNIREQVIPNSQEDMSWIPASWGMKMTLSREVPSKIGSSLRPFVQKLIADSGHDLATILRTATFAVHPGGPKIIDSVKEILELSDEQVQTSREILLQRGNMSSATLPHVWQKLLEKKLPAGTLVVSLAFGPGLTIFGALFETI